MKRDQFLKSLGLGALALATPSVIKATEPIPVEADTCFAVDINSISDFTFGGKKLTPADILNIWKQTGILIYKSHDHIGRPCNAPMVFKGEMKVLNMSKDK